MPATFALRHSQYCSRIPKDTSSTNDTQSQIVKSVPFLLVRFGPNLGTIDARSNARSATSAALLPSLQWCAADILPRTFLINMLVICIAAGPADVKGSCHIRSCTVAGRVSKRAAFRSFSSFNSS